MAVDPSYPAFPMLAFLAFVAAVLPFSWLSNWKNNTGILMYMFWLSLACLNLFVNSLIWHDNSIDKAPVWCDISSRIILATGVAIPASTLCIIRRLHHIFAMQWFMVTDKQRRRAIIEDLAIGIGIPVVQVPLQYIVAGRRYWILEGIGCFPRTHNVWPAYILVFGWPVAIGVISGLYGAMTLYACLWKKKQVGSALRNADMPRDNYFRIVALACSSTFFAAPIGAIFVGMNLSFLDPYRGWHDTHTFYYDISQVPFVQWQSFTPWLVMFEVHRWSKIACAAIFFAIFGFSSEALRAYRNAFWTVANIVGIKRTPKVLPSMPFEVAPNPIELSTNDFGRRSSVSIIPTSARRLSESTICPSIPPKKSDDADKSPARPEGVYVQKGAENNSDISLTVVPTVWSSQITAVSPVSPIDNTPSHANTPSPECPALPQATYTSPGSNANADDMV
ncbi:STE3-domain-containing protein [Rickenella mellea]|uniref:STE3-domain-containing protein n=1 Tax=Rickenella mellea TaxID=50990 RepID=A0A4Y7QHV5_9AGAM|nr:STE3-domain-containing protein [Rickenella mellea]